VMPDQYRYDAIMDSWMVAEGRYHPTPAALRGTLFRAREETAISLWTGVKVDGEHGWGRYLRDGVDVHVCAGNHTTMCDEPNVRVLASRMRASIEAAAAALSPAPVAASVAGD
jgi:thioesterase domain-containing protein